MEQLAYLKDRIKSERLEKKLILAGACTLVSAIILCFSLKCFGFMSFLIVCTALFVPTFYFDWLNRHDGEEKDYAFLSENMPYGIELRSGHTKVIQYSKAVDKYITFRGTLVASYTCDKRCLYIWLLTDKKRAIAALWSEEDGYEFTAPFTNVKDMFCDDYSVVRDWKYYFKDEFSKLLAGSEASAPKKFVNLDEIDPAKIIDYSAI